MSGTFGDVEEIRRKDLEEHKHVWSSKGLLVGPPGRANSDTCYQERGIAQRLMDRYEERCLSIKDKLLTDMSEVISVGRRKMELATDILICELGEVRLQLGDLKVMDAEMVAGLESAWMECIDVWAGDIYEVEKTRLGEVKTPLGRYVKDTLLSRRYLDTVADILLATILEMNQIQLENCHTIQDTCTYLKSLWKKYYKEWKVLLICDSYVDLGDERETLQQDIEIDEQEIFTPEMLQIQSQLVEMREKPQDAQSIIKYLPFHPILLALENCREELKCFNYLMMSCLESEFDNLVEEKRRLLSDLYRDEMCTGSVSSGLESQRHVLRQYEESFSSAVSNVKLFIDSSDTAVSLMVEAWNTLVEKRLEPSGDLYLRNMMRVRREEESWTLAEIMSLNSAMDHLRSAPTLVSLDEVWKGSVEGGFHRLLEVAKKAYNRKNVVVAQVEELRKKCYESLIAWVDWAKSWCSPSLVAETADREESFLLTLTLALQNADSLFAGFMDSVTFLRDNIELNLCTLGDGDWIEGEREEHLFLCKLKEESLRTGQMRARQVYEVRARELREHRCLLMAHVKEINEDVSDMKCINMNYEKAGKCLDGEYEALYKTLTKVKDSLGARKQTRNMKLIYDVKTKYSWIVKRKEEIGSRAEELLERRVEWLDNANNYFLRDLRMFHEGGNYNPEEVSKAIFTLKRCSTEMKEVSKTWRGKLRKMGRGKLSNYSKKASHCLAEIKKACKDAALERMLEVRVENTKREVKRELRVARAEVVKLEGLLASRKAERSLTGWEEMVEEINIIIGYFTYTKPKKGLRGSPSMMTLAGTSRVRPSSAKARKTTGSQKSSRSSHKLRKTRSSHAVQQSVFGYRKRTAGPATFWDMVLNILRNGLNGLHYTFMKHYSKTLKIAYDESLRNIQSMRPKLEVVWMSMIIDLLVLLYMFKIDLSNLLVSKWDVYKEVCITRMTNLKTTHLEEVKALESRLQMGLRYLEKRLKTMYGHTAFSGRLGDVNQEAVDLCEEILVKYRSSIESLRVGMRGFLDGYNVSRHHLEEETTYLILNVHDNQLTDDFLRNIRDIVREVSGMLKAPLSQESLRSAQGAKKNSISNDNDDDDSLDMFCNMNNLTELISIAEQLAEEILDPEDTWNPNSEGQITSLVGVSRVLAKPELVNLEIITEDLREEIIKEFRGLVESSIKKYEDLGGRLQEWIRQWEYNNKEIEKLYEF